MFNFKKIIILLSLCFCAFLSIQPIKAKTTIINDMQIQATVNEDGSASIVEKWDMDVYEGTEVYKIFNNMGPSKIKDFQVEDEKGHHYTNVDEWDVDQSFEEKAYQCGIVQDDDHYELCFGISEYGHRQYTFSYIVTQFVKEYTDAQGFNYAFFSDMDLDVEHVKVSISSSVPFNEKNSAIWAFGYSGNVLFDHGSVVMESKNMVSSDQKVQLLMKLNAGTFKTSYKENESMENIIKEAKEGSDYNDEDYYHNGYYNSFAYKDNTRFIILGLVIAVLIVFIIVILIVLYFVKISKEGKFFSDGIPMKDKDDISMFRDIPCHKDIFEFYYVAKKLDLIKDEDKGGLIAAILLDWIRKNYIVFDKKKETHLLFFKKEGFSIDLSQELPLDNDLERELFALFKKAAGNNELLETGEFEYWCRKNYEKLENWFDDVENTIEKQLRQNKLLTLGRTTTRYLGINIPRDVDVYDASLREEMEHVIGFKEFLEEMSSIDEKEVIEVKLWEEYLIFASILGIADEVEKQLGRLCPTFNEQSQLDTIYTTHMIHTFSYSGVSAMQQARFQGAGGSSSFGGGGSFSGGGGGGVR